MSYEYTCPKCGYRVQLYFGMLRGCVEEYLPVICKSCGHIQHIKDAHATILFKAIIETEDDFFKKFLVYKCEKCGGQEFTFLKEEEVWNINHDANWKPTPLFCPECKQQLLQRPERLID